MTMFTSSTSSTFESFLLKRGIIKALNEVNITTPYYHQREALPSALLGQDIILQSKSGNGKTLVAVLATLMDDYPNSCTGISTLWISHTRELVIQIQAQFVNLSKHLSQFDNEERIAAVFGGIPFFLSAEAVSKHPAVLIGTPGRLVHLLSQRKIEMRSIRRFIMDEADLMLSDTETRSKIQKLFCKTSPDKQTILLGATIDRNSKKMELLRRFCRKDVKEIFDDRLTLVGLQQYEMEIDEKRKIKLLTRILDIVNFKQVIIFTKTQIRAHYLQKELTKICFPAMCMHGSIDQVSRFQIWRDFNHNGRILIATDLMGRGIDLNKVNLVINFDMAQSCEEYLHRIGRASRCNTRGSAISFVAELQEKQLIQTIEQKFVVKVNTIKENDMKGLNDNFLY
eukprot:119149_1